MPNIVSPRALMGLIVPSTNTTVEAEYNRMTPPGVSWHAGRIWIRNEELSDDASFEQFLVELREELGRALRDVMTCRPDRIVMGMSAETFWGGKEGNAQFEAFVKERCGGLPVTTGAGACHAALSKVGARKIGIITPYQPVGDEQVRRFFEELGYEVHAVQGLACTSATNIGDVPAEDVRKAFLDVNGSDVDALVQAGTNLPAVEVAAKLETEIGKPVIAINAATAWYALRSAGIDDQLSGHGSLLERF